VGEKKKRERKKCKASAGLRSFKALLALVMNKVSACCFIR